jgi:hypothetical protein
MAKRIDADDRNLAQDIMDYDNWRKYWDAVILVDTEWQAPSVHLAQMQDKFNITRANETKDIVYW